MHAVICSATEYESTQFQTFMDGERASVYSQWIFDIIEKRYGRKKEQIFIDRPEWCLCADKYHGSDQRYLVVFKDKTLRTIRDLRNIHLDLLIDVQKTIIEWLRVRYPSTFKMFSVFFHYMPSVFQLHLHVNMKSQYINTQRAHYLARVIRNLQSNSEFYVQALILTKLCKTLKRSQTHDTVKVPI
jgi:hypothetical protein